jgi:hypothetical protein
MVERVLIVATGPSLKALDLSLIERLDRRVHILAVNGAVDHLPRCDSWFTLDASPENRLRMQRPRPGVRYFVATSPRRNWSAAEIPAHVTRLVRVEGDGILSAKDRLAENPGCIHTGNSAWGALGLAYHWRPKAIGLLGVDGRPGGYFYGGAGPKTRLDHLPALFATANDQLVSRAIRVRNGSPQSTVECFLKNEPVELIRWIGGKTL